MARRSRSRTANANGRARSHYSTANLRLPLPLVELRPLDLRVFEDRRLYDPTRGVHYPHRRKADGSLPATVVETPRNRNVLGHSFAAPKAVLVCVRRKRRREVLFALNRTGRGARSPKRRNEWSKVKC